MALNLDSNEKAPVISMNTSKLQQGLSINLSKTNPNLKRLAVKINWIGDDLDIACVGLDNNDTPLLRPTEVNFKGRREVVPQDLIFYMNLHQQGIKHGGDVQSQGALETEQMNISCVDLDTQIGGLLFIVTSHVESGSSLLFRDVEAMEAQLVDLDTNEVIYTTELDTTNIANSTGAVFAKLSKGSEGWSYEAQTTSLGKNAHGVQNILDTYYS